MLRPQEENSTAPWEKTAATAHACADKCCRAFPARAVETSIGQPDSPEVLATYVEYSLHGARGAQVDASQLPAAQLSIVYCVDGFGRVRVDEREYDVGPGQVLALRTRQIDDCYARSDDPWTVYRVDLAGRKVDSIHAMLTGPEPCSPFSIGDDLPTIEAIKAIYDTMAGHESHHFRGAFLATAKLVWRLAALSQHPFNALHKDPRIYATLSFMEQRPRERTAVAELAKMAHLSRSRYAQVFKKEMGFSVLEYLIRTRMHRAADLLENSNEQVKKIATSLGFKDALYLSRQFSRIYGVYPTAFRSIARQTQRSVATIDSAPGFT